MNEKIYLNSGGFGSIVGIGLLLLGIIIAVFLVRQNTNLFPKAGAQTITIIDSNGNVQTTTDNPTVKLRVVLPWAIKNTASPTPLPTPSCNPKVFDKETWQVVRVGACAKNKTNISYQCKNVKKVKQEKCSVGNHEVHVPGVECGRAIVLAEDPGFRVNVQEFKYETNPQEIYFTFSEPEKVGMRTIYAKFNAYDENDNIKTVMANPSPITIDYQPIIKRVGANFSVSPKTATFNRGCSYEINVTIDTDGAKTDAVDALVNFESSKMSIADVVSGGFYPNFLRFDLGSNKIDLTGFAQINKPVVGQGTLATIKFSVPQSAALGKTAVTFDFDPVNPDKTTDSNIVETGTVRELLRFVGDGDYMIGTGACTAL